MKRKSIRAAIAGAAVIAAMMIGSVPVASAHQGHSGAPGHLPGKGKDAASGHHPGRPGHGGHPGAPGS